MTERGRIAYLSGLYPHAGSTFITIEVQELRRLGFDVSTFAVREPARDQLVGESIAEEHARTEYLFDGGVSRWIPALLWAASTRPRRLLTAIRHVWTTTPPGVKAKGVAYLLEACLLARVGRDGVRHPQPHQRGIGHGGMAAAELRHRVQPHGTRLGDLLPPDRLGPRREDRARRSLRASRFCRSQCRCSLRAKRGRGSRSPRVFSRSSAGAPTPVPDSPRGSSPDGGEGRRC